MKRNEKIKKKKKRMGRKKVEDSENEVKEDKE